MLRKKVDEELKKEDDANVENVDNVKNAEDVKDAENVKDAEIVKDAEAVNSDENVKDAEAVKDAENIENAETTGNTDNAEDDEDDEKVSGGYRAFLIVRSIVVYLFAIIILVGAAFFAADRSPNKSLFGFRYYTVLTNSMVPEFYSGDMVFVKITPADSINKGDIITFNPSSNSDAYLTHRVIEKIDDYEGTGVTCFRTQGDANDSEDSFLVDEERVIGIVKFHVPKLGIVIRFLQLRWYFVLPLVIMLFVFLGLIKYYFELREEGDEDEEEQEDEQSEREPKQEQEQEPKQEQEQEPVSTPEVEIKK